MKQNTLFFEQLNPENNGIYTFKLKQFFGIKIVKTFEVIRFSVVMWLKISSSNLLIKFFIRN